MSVSLLSELEQVDCALPLTDHSNSCEILHEVNHRQRDFKTLRLNINWN
jgi:hypothetical protein